MTQKRFKKGYCCGDTGLIDNEKEEWFVENINSISDLERNWNDVLDKLNEVADENERLKQSVNNLKDTIIKITIAYQRKYDRNIVDLVHEVHDEDITDLIKELPE